MVPLDIVIIRGKMKKVVVGTVERAKEVEREMAISIR
jgi:hypothetical protein